MKKVIRLRVLIDHEDVVFRDIEVTCEDSFAQVHDLIQEAFGFDKSQMASFYVSNHDWEKGQEITLMDVGEKSEGGEPILLMHDTQIRDIVFESGQKLLYVFDFFLMWCFYIDVIEVKKLQETVIVPRITQRFGESPDQYGKSPEISFEIEEAPETEDEDDFGDMFDLLGMNEGLSDEREY